MAVPHIEGGPTTGANYDTAIFISCSLSHKMRPKRKPETRKETHRPFTSKLDFYHITYYNSNAQSNATNSLRNTVTDCGYGNIDPFNHKILFFKHLHDNTGLLVFDSVYFYLMPYVELVFDQITDKDIIWIRHI